VERVCRPSQGNLDPTNLKVFHTDHLGFCISFVWDFVLVGPMLDTVDLRDPESSGGNFNPADRNPTSVLLMPSKATREGIFLHNVGHR
jgi:hypothetical protein